MAIAIASPHNERIKATARLDKRSERDQRRMTRAEGLREAAMALSAGVVPVEAYVCRQIAASAEARAAIETLERLDRERRTFLYEVTVEAFSRLAVREESGGIVLVTPFVTRPLETLPLGETPFVCIVEGVEKPGNLGAILRSADAAGVDAVIVTNGATDLHNPNVIRASLGAYYTVPICEAPAGEVLRFLRAKGLKVAAAHPAASLLYTDCQLGGAAAIVLGAEASGLSEQWRAAADHLVRIPMRGRADSLNLATAAALLFYEVVRQRGLNHA